MKKVHLPSVFAALVVGLLLGSVLRVAPSAKAQAAVGSSRFQIATFCGTDPQSNMAVYGAYTLDTVTGELWVNGTPAVGDRKLSEPRR
jgi:hypothetical protein